MTSKIETLPLGSGDELPISAMSDQELLREREFYNEMLETAFMLDSGQYDTIATVVREIEGELNRREHEGPPWLHE